LEQRQSSVAGCEALRVGGLRVSVAYCGRDGGCRRQHGFVEYSGPSARGRSAQSPLFFLFFGGVDLWRYGDFLYGGGLWSPGGLDRDGFTLKLLLNSGRYRYFAGDL
jgi:hypothetical protein